MMVGSSDKLNVYTTSIDKGGACLLVLTHLEIHIYTLRLCSPCRLIEQAYIWLSQ